MLYAETNFYLNNIKYKFNKLNYEIVDGLYILKNNYNNYDINLLINTYINMILMI